MSSNNEYYFKEGCFISEWHNTQSDAQCSVARVRVEAQQTTRLHSLKDTQERYIILDGEAKVTVGEQEWNVSSGDVVLIPENVPQKIQNLANTDLVFLAVCTPRFQEINYQDLEDT